MNSPHTVKTAGLRPQPQTRQLSVTAVITVYDLSQQTSRTQRANCPGRPSPAPEILTASASAFSREARPAATTDSMTATQRCLSGKLGAMK